ncbi:thiosulfate reductase [Salmonella enterica subsp. enterica serovar Typhi]|nr:thiosulfate reductase [Salmonella enterica subsp. enterica serovar Typhi]CGJ44855.1 thiosulfate reductase [Salmonella enterica subsp. enterica serovar Typhi]CGJ63176.1 thiosulfate reductase [Salmonella enterica subsp. enterica serovar Typhi]CGM08935.1 thiosulfate reductase [Salmonella enterica subsp. enterica serovar Typhi]
MSISRRSFLQGVGIGCSACALGAFPPGALARNPIAGINGKTTLTPSLCEMCSFRCPIQAQVVNNKTVFIQGNPSAPQQGTRICARGGSGVSLVNDPQRIVKPMKRTGPRGDGEWQVISWQQAYQEIAAKMNAIKAQHGPESVAFSSKSGSLSSHLFHLATAFGSPNTFTHASTCPAGKAIAAKVMMGGDLAMDIANTRYLVSFGHNLYEGIEVADTHELMTAQEKGAKMVSFDPRLSIFSSKADEWHAIRPGGDLAVLLAMCHVMIDEQLYDASFVERYTSGFEQLAQAVKETTSEWAAAQADVPADVIVRVTRELAACAPHAIVSPGHRATFSQEEIDMRRMIFTLNVLLGNIEREGGLYQKKNASVYNKLAGEKVAPTLAKLNIKNMPKPTAQRIDLVAPQFKYIAAGGGVVQSIIDAALTQKPYPIKAWIMSRHNPFQTVTCRSDLVKTVEQLDPGGQLRCLFERERGICRLSAAGMHLSRTGRRGIRYVGSAPGLRSAPTGRRADWRGASELANLERTWRAVGIRAVLSVAGYADAPTLSVERRPCLSEGTATERVSRMGRSAAITRTRIRSSVYGALPRRYRDGQ